MPTSLLWIRKTPLLALTTAAIVGGPGHAFSAEPLDAGQRTRIIQEGGRARPTSAGSQAAQPGISAHPPPQQQQLREQDQPIEPATAAGDPGDAAKRQSIIRTHIPVAGKCGWEELSAAGRTNLTGEGKPAFSPVVGDIEVVGVGRGHHGPDQREHARLIPGANSLSGCTKWRSLMPRKLS